MKKQTKYNELTDVVNYINSSTSKEMGFDMKQDTKLTRKAVRFMKNIKHLIDDYNDRSIDMQSEFASTYAKNKDNDAKGISGCLITDEKGTFVFTPENLKKRNKKLKELGEEHIEIDIVYCTDMDCINQLSPILKDKLNGFLFILTEQEEEEETETEIKTQKNEPATLS